MLKTLPVQGVKMPEHFSALYNATFFESIFTKNPVTLVKKPDFVKICFTKIRLF